MIDTRRSSIARRLSFLGHLMVYQITTMNIRCLYVHIGYTYGYKKEEKGYDLS